ncbi:NAD(P)H-dependent oxidoreductase [Pseudomonas yamanorum]|uniref:NAD(P)H-dependent oxidoreductase n=1 Tax=Pseudomonas yamanorum TaxID=515393 RepID=A0A7Y8FE77_9PSED|nr:NAD(P)H-dependent oxidoreductase [Pseudomonas yamanorum]
MHVFHIDSSISDEMSINRQLSSNIVARLREIHPALEVTYRDLMQSQLSNHRHFNSPSRRRRMVPQL